MRSSRPLGIAGLLAAALIVAACGASRSNAPSQVTAPLPPGVEDSAAGEAAPPPAQAGGARQRSWTPVSRGSSSDLETNESSASTALARCCASLRQYGEVGPERDRETYLAAAASCNGLRHTEGVPSTALWNQLRSMLSGVAVPQACR